MRTVNEVSKLTGVSVRTLHYYDQIGLLGPTDATEAGYRLYGDEALERLQQILLFRELKFSLKDIKEILDSPGFDRKKALRQQIELLTLKRNHLQNLIDFAVGMEAIGMKYMDFTAFDTRKIDEYAKRAKEAWGNTEAYKEFEEKNKDRTKEEEKQCENQIMDIFAGFGRIKDLEPDSREAQEQAAKLHRFINDNCYTCTPQIFQGLANMYDGGGSITDNINRAAGEGTAEFAAKAIRVYSANPKNFS